MGQQTLINTPEDMEWLRDVHLPRLDLQAYRSAILYGNEDYPRRIEVYASRDPEVGDQPVIFEPDHEGTYQRASEARAHPHQHGRMSETRSANLSRSEWRRDVIDGLMHYGQHDEATANRIFERYEHEMWQRWRNGDDPGYVARNFVDVWKHETLREPRRRPSQHRGLTYGNWIAEVAEIMERHGGRHRFEDISVAYWRQLYSAGYTPEQAVAEAIGSEDPFVIGHRDEMGEPIAHEVRPDETYRGVPIYIVDRGDGAHWDVWYADSPEHTTAGTYRTYADAFEAAKRAIDADPRFTPPPSSRRTRRR